MTTDNKAVLNDAIKRFQEYVNKGVIFDDAVIQLILDILACAEEVIKERDSMK